MSALLPLAEAEPGFSLWHDMATAPHHDQPVRLLVLGSKDGGRCTWTVGGAWRWAMMKNPQGQEVASWWCRFTARGEFYAIVEDREHEVAGWVVQPIGWQPA